MKIGIDGGTTLTKFAWQGAHEVEFRSTADSSLESIYDEAQATGITTAQVIGSTAVEHPFQELPRAEDPIKEEATFQARGARQLAGVRGCLVVGIGTGVSYTRVVLGKPILMPVGSALGGGFLDGMRKLESLLSRDSVGWRTFNRFALETDRPDMMVGDLYPDHPAKDFVLAHFGKMTGQPGEVCAGAVSTVATSIAKDLILYSLFTKDVVFVGTAAQSESVQRRLKIFQPVLKKRFHFPEKGAFAGALGALLAR